MLSMKVKAIYFVFFLLCILSCLLLYEHENDKVIKDTFIASNNETEIKISDLEKYHRVDEKKTSDIETNSQTKGEMIRVLLTNPDNGSIYHESKEGGIAYNDYSGKIEVTETPCGYVVINELPLEEYLYSVVPSEMPASYPMEALKAQAICARTYAYLHIMNPGYPEWNAHVDDTTAFQVYHKVSGQEQTTKAVDETKGLILMEPDGVLPAQTYYYSTSCGLGSDAHVWKSKYADAYSYLVPKHINPKGNYEGIVLDEALLEQYFKEGNKEDYEFGESWYRWQYVLEEFNKDDFYDTLKKRYAANEKFVLTLKKREYISSPIKDTGDILGMEIVKRGAGGIAEELVVRTKKADYKIVTELNIRYILNNGKNCIIRQDGYEVTDMKLLPSAFIYLKPFCKKGILAGYHIWGGGYGHGAGMSQNAAKAMAQEGMKAEDILLFFYQNCFLQKIEE